MTKSYDFLITQQKCLHTTFNLTYSEEPDFAHCKDFFVCLFVLYGHRVFLVVLVWLGGGGGKVGGGLGGLVGGQGVLVILLLLFGVGLFLNTRASVTTRMAEAFTEDSVVQTTEDF